MSTVSMKQFGKRHQTATRRRVKLTPFAEDALTLVNAMVKNGFVFFSSVQQSSQQVKTYQKLYEDEFVTTDSLYFHLDGHDCIVCVTLAEQKILGFEVKTLLNVRVWMADYYGISLSALGAIMRLARERGMTHLVREHEAWDDKVELPYIPWIDIRPEIPGWKIQGHHHDVSYFSKVELTRRVEPHDVLPKLITEFTDSLLTVRDFMQTDRKIGRMFTSELLYGEFDRNDEATRDDFFKKFNLRYLRELVVQLRK